MDQARWLVVFSVVICMATTLTILKHLYPQKELNDLERVTNTESVALEIDNSKLPKKNITRFSLPSKRRLKVDFSPPPSHIFATDRISDFNAEAKNMKTKGRILE